MGWLACNLASERGKRCQNGRFSSEFRRYVWKFSRFEDHGLIVAGCKVGLLRWKAALTASTTQFNVCNVIFYSCLRRLLGRSGAVLSTCTCHSLREHNLPLGVACVLRILPAACVLRIAALQVGHLCWYRRAVICPVRTRN